ncbi:MAG: DUF2064 domain-containing protein [Actinobacteria bacterium]|nr:DUF2064 domain-containing protein [Actinomycetota bacterium]MBW3643431.1 DUF2064 domain-containing protein [Actinomycetota bacterium]
MAKAPVAGTVKTRLCPPCSAEDAAMVAEACLADTLEAVAACGAGRKVVALDGQVGAWLPPGLQVIAQRGATFAERLVHAWADTGGPGIQIGMDTPQVGHDELDGLLALLVRGAERQAVVGPAEDGGWWALGLPALMPGGHRAVFQGVPMSTPLTGASQVTRLRHLGFEVTMGARRRDIDTISDLAEVAALIPKSRTAMAASNLGLIPSALP